MKSIWIAVFLLANILTGVVNAEKQPTTENEKFSYAVGVQIAQDISRQNFQLDLDSFVQAMRDIISSTPLKVSVEDMKQALLSYRDKEQKKQDTAGNVNKIEGEKFLAANKTKEGVVSVPGGLQYKIITKGEGPKPTSDSSVLVHYRGTLLNGKEFDSSYTRGEPISLNLKNVIQAWQIALPMMQTGAKWQLYVPSNLAYGPQAAGPDIGPNSTLIFDIELISIN
ncbi:MAG: FKBP-type peptidyl-prolyl cis-trans isomerase FklB [Gammaproteobacteria bacterium]|jgi:FKBP-type peptidyl-prolyl cis-trans isomerase FklB